MGATSFPGTGLDTWPVSKCINLEDMFYNTELNAQLTNWDVSAGQNFEGYLRRIICSMVISEVVLSIMDYFFASMSENSDAFNADISRWKVANGTTFKHTFRGASIFKKRIGIWVVSRRFTFEGTFAYIDPFNADITGWSGMLVDT